MKKKKFDIGKVLATPGALEAFEKTGENLTNFVYRHSLCDWGYSDPEDIKVNEEALESGARLMSVFLLKDKTEIWVITEAQNDEGVREVTTVLLPEDY